MTMFDALNMLDAVDAMNAVAQSTVATYAVGTAAGLAITTLLLLMGGLW